MVPLVHPSPHPKRHLDRFSCFAGLTIATHQPTERQTDTPRYSVCNNRPHLHSSEMQHNNKLCNIVLIIIIIIIHSFLYRHKVVTSEAVVLTDGTNQSHNINKICNVNLYRSTNFLNAPRTNCPTTTGLAWSDLL